MTDTPKPENEPCISDKPWSTVLNKAAKLATIGFFQEFGKSVGKFIFYPLIALLVLFALSYALDYFTGWFSSMFDFWPFNRGGADVAVPPEFSDGRPWYKFWGSDETPSSTLPAPTPEPVAAQPVEPAENTPENGEPETKWYCKFNPIC